MEILDLKYIINKMKYSLKGLNCKFQPTEERSGQCREKEDEEK